MNVTRWHNLKKKPASSGFGVGHKCKKRSIKPWFTKFSLCTRDTRTAHMYASQMTRTKAARDCVCTSQGCRGKAVAAARQTRDWDPPSFIIWQVGDACQPRFGPRCALLPLKECLAANFHQGPCGNLRCRKTLLTLVVCSRNASLSKCLNKHGKFVQMFSTSVMDSSHSI